MLLLQSVNRDVYASGRNKTNHCNVVVIGGNMGKKWYLSKTINYNAIFLALVAIATEGFGLKIDPNIIVGAQTLMNILIRKYFTREPIV